MKGATSEQAKIDRLIEVSIHAPMKGATGTEGTSTPSMSFNPRTHEGCDVAMVRSKERNNEFQSTHP